MNIILYLSVITAFGLVIINNPENRVTVSLLSALLISSVSIRHTMILNVEKYYILGFFMSLMDTALVYWMILADKTGLSIILLLVLTGEAVIAYRTIHSLVLALIGYFSYCVAMYIKSSYPDIIEFIPFAMANVTSFVFVFGVMYVAKYQIGQRQKLAEAMEEIRIKTRQLEEAYEKLKENAQILEAMTILKERNRIAREIHDTVGHTLTTVLVEIEASKRLMQKDAEMSMEKLELAQQQVRKGLNDIRQSVRMLKEGGNVLLFVPSLRSLIHETEKHAGVTLKGDVQDITGLPVEVEKTVYRCLQEGLTNGIRHGKCTEFHFTLKVVDNVLFFELVDNGIGCDNIVPGFGLTSMAERVKQLGGKLHIESKAGHGCRITISIPVIVQKEVRSEFD